MIRIFALGLLLILVSMVYSATILPTDTNEQVVTKLKATAEELKIVTVIEKNDNESTLNMGFKTDAFKALLVFNSVQIPSDSNKKYSVVIINFFTNVEVAKDKDKVLEVLNQFHNEYWSGTFSIDDNNKIKGKFSVLIPPDGMNGNAVFAGSMMILQGWEMLFPLLKPYI